jgi:hypothetical protein
MSKKEKLARKNALANIPVTSETVTPVTPVTETVTPNVNTLQNTHKTVTIDMKKMFLTLKKSFFVTCKIILSDGTEKDLNECYPKVGEFILSTLTVNADVEKKNIYVMSRQHFLNIFCRLYEISPSLSKHFNGKGDNKVNKTVSMYGQDVIGLFPVTFDVDTYFDKVGLGTYANFVTGGVNFFYPSKSTKVFFASKAVYDIFAKGELLNDAPVNVVDVPLATLETFKKTLNVKEETNEPTNDEVNETK